ncbi:hypothetical protein [Neobacillus cucumis]|nr:hypothetical protein [Neobacillus cucumis]MBM7654564.1 hypothetical protein [Neobacillus cucumis]
MMTGYVQVVVLVPTFHVHVMLPLLSAVCGYHPAAVLRPKL